MKSPPRHWVSSTIPDQLALELEADDVTHAVHQVRTMNWVEPALVVLGCGGKGLADIRGAVSVAKAGFAKSHICLSVPASSPRYTGLDDLRDDQVGLLLDDVDAETPLARISDQSIEAIRFERAFAMHAAENLRSNCVLSAMFGLARDLGLCTLGPEMPVSSELLGNHLQFDFTPEARKGARRSTKTAIASKNRSGETVHLTAPEGARISIRRARG